MNPFRRLPPPPLNPVPSPPTAAASPRGGCTSRTASSTAAPASAAAPRCARNPGSVRKTTASKFRKSRLVALSADARRELELYLEQRLRDRPEPATPLLAHGPDARRAYTGAGLWEGLRQLFRAADIRDSKGALPRVHALRHTYARHVLLREYRCGRDPQALLPALATAMGHVSPASTAPLRGFFAENLPQVRGLSRHTMLAYRDALKLLLRYLEAHLGRSAATFDFPDLAPDHVLAFLAHLETGRGNCTATRNSRLAALHAFARYAAAHHPEHLELCQRILSIPFKRADQRLVEYLDADELQAQLAAPEPTPDGRRDYTLLLALHNTGARVQAILDLRPATCIWSALGKPGCTAKAASRAGARCGPIPCRLCKPCSARPGARPRAPSRSSSNDGASR